MFAKLKIYSLIFFSLSGFSMVIDNVNDIRAQWSAVSDNVMGGISEVSFYEIQDIERNFYRLEGSVSTENNGGFIQSILRNNQDAQNYNGIRITVRGTPDDYYIWLRTPACRFPWDRYSASFKPNDNWSVIEIPFSDIKKSNFYMPKRLNKSKIRTIALAAYGKDFDAKLDIANIELY